MHIALPLARFKNLLFLQGCKFEVLGRTETIGYEQSTGGITNDKH